MHHLGKIITVGLEIFAVMTFSRLVLSAKIKFAKFNFTPYMCQMILVILENLIREIVIKLQTAKISFCENFQSCGIKFVMHNDHSGQKNTEQVLERMM